MQPVYNVTQVALFYSLFLIPHPRAKKLLSSSNLRLRTFLSVDLILIYSTPYRPFHFPSPRVPQPITFPSGLSADIARNNWDDGPYPRALTEGKLDCVVAVTFTGEGQRRLERHQVASRSGERVIWVYKSDRDLRLDDDNLVLEVSARERAISLP